MKKLIYTFVAALALVACTPDNGVSNKVRISVSFEEEQQNTKGQQRISAEDKLIKGKRVIDVNWEKGDVLYFQKEGEAVDTDNPFQIVSGVGTKHAFFENEEFIDFQSTFTLYYHGFGNPLDEKKPTHPDFAQPLVPSIDQTCTITASGTEINNDYLIYKATNCKVGEGIKLEPQFAILGVQLFGTYTSFDEYVTIGVGDEFNPEGKAYQCNPSASIDLTKNPIYYIVLPLDYPINKKKIRLANQRGHHTSYDELSLELVTLDPTKAQIIGIDVTNYNNQSDDNAKYTIAKHNYN